MKAELEDGIIRIMAGGTRAHARVQANLMIAAGNALRGSGCRPYGSDIGVRTRERTIRYPDLTIDCGAPGDGNDDLTLSAPSAVIEVLSYSTRSSDLGAKKDEYRALDSVDTIVFVDVEQKTVSVLQRIDGGWTDMLFAAVDLVIPSLGITIGYADIFAD